MGGERASLFVHGGVGVLGGDRSHGEARDFVQAKETAPVPGSGLRRHEQRPATCNERAAEDPTPRSRHGRLTNQPSKCSQCLTPCNAAFARQPARHAPTEPQALDPSLVGIARALGSTARYVRCAQTYGMRHGAPISTAPRLPVTLSVQRREGPRHAHSHRHSSSSSAAAAPPPTCRGRRRAYSSCTRRRRIRAYRPPR